MLPNIAYKSPLKGLSLPTRIHSLQKTGRRKHFHRKVAIDFTSKNFRVRTIDSFNDFLKVLELRHLVFQKEFAGKRFCLRSDRDKYDRYADFLVVEDLDTDQIVGCYRMICSQFSTDFYSSSEFDISELAESTNVKVELSRAAILKEFRNGRVINLLWRGVAAYINATNADYLFGCGSVQTMDQSEIEGLASHFETSNAVSETMFFVAKKKYRLTAESPSAVLPGSTNVVLPPLLRTYLKAGAVVCSEPAIDRKFKCTDFLVILECSKIQSAFRERYRVN